MPISPFYLTQDQHKIIESPINSRTFLSGPSGTGKTTVGVERVMHLLENGIPGSQILLLVPQRTLATSYYDALNHPGTPAGSMVAILTIGGLARRMVDVFWPLVSNDAGFSQPDHPPIFLTLETAQYFMAHLVRPRLAEGYFDNVTIDRNRIHSQILDNLSKAAVHGFPHTEIGERLKSAWVGDSGQLHIYEDAQNCAVIFRQFCLDNNLLDFSLQLEIFRNQLWPASICREYLLEHFHYLVFDNLEESTPVTVDILREWLPHFDSALLIYDQDAGYRRFLGADPDVSATLADVCEATIHFYDGFVSSDAIINFGDALTNSLRPTNQLPKKEKHAVDRKNFALVYPQPPIRFYPEMLDWVADQISALIERGALPGEIVVLAPYLSDALRYALVDRLNRLDIPSRSHRPSRSLKEEPAARCLLTLSKLGHPDWGMIPQNSDVAYALMQAIADLDLNRAQLLVQSVYQRGKLYSFEDAKPEVQERFTYVLGDRYEVFHKWLSNYIESGSDDLDHFLSRLFGEVISQPGFGFFGDYTAGAVAANLVESIMKFRWVAGELLSAEGVPLGWEYIQMVEDGVIASQYLIPWQTDPEDAVFLAPAYTYLMSNRPVDYQFWLDVGGHGWYERLYQPLTHPHVLNRNWPVGLPWTDTNEIDASRDALYRLSLGLIRHCRKGIFLGFSELSEQGYDHKGELLRAIAKAVRNQPHN